MNVLGALCRRATGVLGTSACLSTCSLAVIEVKKLKLLLALDSMGVFTAIL